MGVPERPAEDAQVERPASTVSQQQRVDSEQAMTGSEPDILYPVAPQQVAWPRVFPQL